jgi:DNA-directed RNA polymerase subunit RPC12/RpoP
MKTYHCPDCGREQEQEIDWPSRLKVRCPVCGNALLVKFDKTGLSVKVLNSAPSGSTVQPD